MKLTGLPPAAVWAMRADEAMLMLAARKRLVESTLSAAAPARSPGIIRRPGTISFGSLEDLRAILPRGKEQ